MTQNLGMKVYGWAIVGLLTAGTAWGQDGSIVPWGDNGEGQCIVPAPNEDFVAISAGGSHSLGLRADGTIEAWGCAGNDYGQCAEPVPNTDFMAVAAGDHHSCVLNADTSIECWGRNTSGQCNVPGPNIGFVAVAAGQPHSLGLKADGSIVPWGDCSYGLCNVPAPNTGFVAIAAGHHHSCGLKTDTSIVCWGYNDYGQCNVPAPNADFVALAAGAHHSLGVKGADGSIEAWGCCDASCPSHYGQCNVPQPNTDFVALAAGGHHSLGVKGADGSIVAWGRNDFGQCDVPAPNTGFVTAAGGADHTLGLKAPAGSSCGNGVLDLGEECDDGNNDDGDCCSATCTLDPAGTACGDPADNYCTDPDTCDGNGVCLANDASDGSFCNDGLFCTAGESCTSGVCGGGVARNCEDGMLCTTDTCDTDVDACVSVLDPGYCLFGYDKDAACYEDGETNPINECEACIPNQDPEDWSPLPAGTECGEPADTDCDNPDTCDAFGFCQENNEPDGTVCTDDGNDCTNDICEAKQCTHPNRPDGMACGDVDPLNECDNGDTCDGQGACQENNKPFGTACTDDGNDCTNDICEAKECTHPNKDAGESCGDVGPLNECDNGDTCDGMGTCQENNEPDGTVCTDDGNDCTNDICEAKQCTHPNRPDGTACGAVDPLNECDNGDTCDGQGACQGNNKPFGTACTDDGNDCTNDICEAKQCTHPNKDAGEACGDVGPLNECDNGDTCDGLGTCQENNKPDGTACTDEGNDCTNDICEAKQCMHPNWPDGTACGDVGPLNECDDGDICDGMGACQENNKPFGTACTDDGNDCTNDICEAKQCTHPNWPADRPCGDDSDSDCDNPDTCDGMGVCLENNEDGGLPCTDDGDRCTNDVCNADKACTHPRWPVDDERACGACCYKVAGKCYGERLADECLGDHWSPNEFCDGWEINCEKVVVPAISEWGLLVASVLLLIGIAIKFARRRPNEA